jgi:hypothetical protein
MCYYSCIRLRGAPSGVFGIRRRARASPFFERTSRRQTNLTCRVESPSTTRLSLNWLGFPSWTSSRRPQRPNARNENCPSQLWLTSSTPTFSSSVDHRAAAHRVLPSRFVIAPGRSCGRSMCLKGGGDFVDVQRHVANAVSVRVRQLLQSGRRESARYVGIGSIHRPTTTT